MRTEVLSRTQHGTRTATFLLGPTGGWKRRIAVLIATIGVSCGIALAEGKPDTRGLKVQPIQISWQSLTGFDKQNRNTHQFGRLEWRGGAVLTSPSAYFGGWSGLALDESGRRFVAVSDASVWMTGEFDYDGNRLSGVQSTRIGPLLAVGGKALLKGRDRDAEGLTLGAGSLAGGQLLISFEGNDRVGRFPVRPDGIGAPSGYIDIPSEVKKVRSVDGIEAIAAIRGGPLAGSTIVFSENPLPGETDRPGWILAGSAAPKRFTLTDINDYGVTDTAALPDGSLVVLERRFRWLEGVRVRLRLIKASELKSGARIAGDILMEADLNQEIDNLEGLAVHAGPQGETILTLISDDNYNPLLQRTVLLQFALPARSLAAN